MVTSTVVLTRTQVNVLRSVAAIRNLRSQSGEGRQNHSVSSIIREILMDMLPQLEAEVREAGFNIPDEGTIADSPGA